jgi:hypothetical protein
MYLSTIIIENIMRTIDYVSEIYCHKPGFPIKPLIFVLFLLLIKSGNAQNYGFGTLLDSSLYKNSPTAAPLMRGDYDDLPFSVSLKEYTPIPGNQGSTSTCAAWATAYAGRTILDALKYQWGRDSANKNTFSPSFVYNQIRMSKTCNGGTSLIDALDVIKNEGSIKFKEFGFECSRDVTEQDKSHAGDYKIIEYRDIFSSKVINKVKLVKKSLAEKHPVVIALDCPPSFMSAKEVMKPDSSEYKSWARGHALVVIGYDDHKYGGAFEIINSWGTKWGNKGFTWIKYADFQFFVPLAFELIDKRIPDPAKYDLSGTLSFKKSNGEPMKVRQDGDFLAMDKSYPSGTLFELKISNNEPAYVYAFSSDLTFKTYKIFPFTDRMVAYLPYSQNNVAIPDEESYNQLDTTTGKSYYCFLYSKEKLDIQNIMQKVEGAAGTMWERIKSVLESSMVDKNNIDFNFSDDIWFKAKSGGRSVIPVLIEINHY